jgi:hypothetical protein
MNWGKFTGVRRATVLASRRYFGMNTRPIIPRGLAGQPVTGAIPFCGRAVLPRSTILAASERSEVGGRAGSELCSARPGLSCGGTTAPPALWCGSPDDHFHHRGRMTTPRLNSRHRFFNSPRRPVFATLIRMNQYLNSVQYPHRWFPRWRSEKKPGCSSFLSVSIRVIRGCLFWLRLCRAGCIRVHPWLKHFSDCMVG